MPIGFMERLAGMLFSPRNYSKKLVSETGFHKKFFSTFLFVQYLSVFLGFVVMFTFLYPELQWYPDAIKTGPDMFIISLGDPKFLIIVFFVGYLLIIAINYLFFGFINYFVCKILSPHNTSVTDRAKKERVENGGNPSKMGPNQHGFKKFLALYGFSLVPMALFGVFDIFWIYFFEKINYASVTFPFVDFTVPVIIFFTILIIILIWRWGIQVRINQEYFNLSIKRSLIPILIHFILLTIVLIVGAYFGNQIALQFA